MTETNRNCYVENIDGSGGRINLTIKLDNTLPLVFINDSTIASHKIFSKTLIIKDTTKILYGTNDASKTRFKYLFNGVNSYNNINISYYYDNKFKDIICLPTLDYYDTDLENGSLVVVDGFKVGCDKPVTGTSLGLSYPNENMTFKYPEPLSSLDNVELIELNLHGLYNRASIREYKGMLDSVGKGSVSTSINGITFVKINKNDLFGNDVKLPTYVLTPLDFIKFRLKYVYVTSTDYIYIPIPN